MVHGAEHNVRKKWMLLVSHQINSITPVAPCMYSIASCTRVGVQHHGNIEGLKPMNNKLSFVAPMCV